MADQTEPTHDTSGQGCRKPAPLVVIEMGDRVILATATDRAPDHLGTVIERDPYPDRDVMVRVLHDDGITRWRRRDSLRALGHRMAADDLTADLELMGCAR